MEQLPGRRAGTSLTHPGAEQLGQAAERAVRGEEREGTAGLRHPSPVEKGRRSSHLHVHLRQSQPRASLGLRWGLLTPVLLRVILRSLEWDGF